MDISPLLYLFLNHLLLWHDRSRDGSSGQKIKYFMWIKYIYFDKAKKDQGDSSRISHENFRAIDPPTNLQHGQLALPTRWKWRLILQWMVQAKRWRQIPVSGSDWNAIYLSAWYRFLFGHSSRFIAHPSSKKTYLRWTSAAVPQSYGITYMRMPQAFDPIIVEGFWDGRKNWILKRAPHI